jgi:S-disulfanyl-L-cysteine oxidoreductase SoxD
MDDALRPVNSDRRQSVSIELILPWEMRLPVVTDIVTLLADFVHRHLGLWDISIGPDGAGLPAGSGTPAQGAVVYAQKCEICHGKEGQNGPNAALSGPQRTVANYVPHATTIFDFTRRAMPWQQPKSLSNDEVYAVTAYILALNKIIGDNDVMNAQTLPKVRMPNSDGFVSRYPDKH